MSRSNSLSITNTPMKCLCPFFITRLNQLKNIYNIEQSQFMWPLKSIHQIGAGPSDTPFERLAVGGMLGVCFREIIYSACTGDIEMALRSDSSLVGKPPCVVESQGIEVVLGEDSVSLG